MLGVPQDTARKRDTMSKTTIALALAVPLNGNQPGPDEGPDATIARLRRLAVKLSARLWELQAQDDETLARTLVDSYPVYDAGDAP